MVRYAFTLVAAVLVLGMSARAAPPIEAYGRLPATSYVRLSPSGDRIAMIETAGEKRLFVIVTPDRKLIRIADVGQLKVTGLVWAGEDRILVFSASNFKSDVLGHSNFVYSAETALSIDVRSGKSFQLSTTNGVANEIDGFYGVAQSDGHWFGLLTISTSYDLYRVNVDTGDSVSIAEGYPDSDKWAVSAGGEVLARSNHGGRRGRWQILAGHDGDRALAEGHSYFGGVADLHLGSTADRLLAQTPDEGSGEDHGSYSYHDLSLNGGSEKPVANADQIEDTIVDPFSRLWIGYIRKGDEQEPILLSPVLEARWRGVRKAFPDNFVHLESWNADFSELVVHTDGAGDSGTYWYVDIQKRSAVLIGLEYEAIKPADVGPVRMVDWRATDGLPLHGVLTLPPGRPEKPLPLVVLPHGGPEDRDYPGFDWWAQAYASRGYAVFQPNFRGSSGYGLAFRDAGFGEWGRKMQTDISDGVAELARQGIVDPKRACIVGASYGGYAALAGVTVQQGLYRCAVSVAGVADLTAKLRAGANVAGKMSPVMRYWRAYMGATSSTDGALDDISPVVLAGRADAPILLIHGKDDSTVPYNQSARMEAALKDAGKPVEFVTLDHEDHDLSREPTRIQMLKAAVAFVEKYNPAN